VFSESPGQIALSMVGILLFGAWASGPYLLAHRGALRHQD
jgi:hypothetical protein